jgi:hypothetical protein
MDRGLDPRARDAYREPLREVATLAWITVRIVVITALLGLTIVGIPFAVLYFIRRVVAASVCVVEDLPADAAIARSTRLVRGQGWRVFSLTAAVGLVAFATGPVIGVCVLLIWSPALTVVNLVSSIVYALVMPYVGITLTLLYFDLRRRHAADPELRTVVVDSP